MKAIEYFFAADLKACYTKSGSTLYLDMSIKESEHCKRNLKFNLDEEYINEENLNYLENLDSLVKKLNILNNIKYGKKSWESLIGSWLLHFVSNVMFRYYIIEKYFKDNIDEMICYNLLSDNCCIAHDYSEYTNEIEHERLNINIVNDIIEFIITSKIDQYKKLISKYPIIKNKNVAKRFMARFINSISSPIKMYVSTFDLLDIFKFIIKSKGKILPFIDYVVPIKDIKIDEIKRNKLSTINIEKKSTNELSNLLKLMIGKYLPIKYLEGYKQLEKEVILANVDKLVTDVGMYHNDAFKINLMHSMERGSKLITVQHGGSYGMLSSMLVERFEINLSDIYWTWGWGDKESSKNLKGLPSHLLSKLKSFTKHRINNSTKISDKTLLVLTELPRFQNRSSSIPISWNFSDSIYRAIELLNSMNQNGVKSSIKYYPRNRGWNYSDLVEKINYDHNIDCRPAIAFNDYKSIVTESVGTTILELMVVHENPILFLDLMQWEISDEFKELLPELEKANYVFTCVDRLSDYLAGKIPLCEDIKFKDNVKQNFIEKFAKNDKYWINIWITELMQDETS